jgi:hypothetical protein
VTETTDILFISTRIGCFLFSKFLLFVGKGFWNFFFLHNDEANAISKSKCTENLALGDSDSGRDKDKVIA